MRLSVLVAMSGGVDSAVAALLLKQAGHDVVGATMCFGLEAGPGSPAICCGAAGLSVSRKPEIQDLCFVGCGSHRDLLARRRAVSTPGPIVDAAGHVPGRH